MYTLPGDLYTPQSPQDVFNWLPARLKLINQSMIGVKTGDRLVSHNKPASIGYFDVYFS